MGEILKDLRFEDVFFLIPRFWNLSFYNQQYMYGRVGNLLIAIWCSVTLSSQ